ncbi:MAG: hypothetical protein V8S27_05665 [Lachnospiraceae bacterium]
MPARKKPSRPRASVTHPGKSRRVGQKEEEYRASDGLDHYHSASSDCGRDLCSHESSCHDHQPGEDTHVCRKCGADDAGALPR